MIVKVINLNEISKFGINQIFLYLFIKNIPIY